MYIIEWFDIWINGIRVQLNDTNMINNGMNNCGCLKIAHKFIFNEPNSI
jgi:hypothetical protein